MAPGKRRVNNRKAAAAALRQWKVGDLVLAKVKGFPAWPATVLLLFSPLLIAILNLFVVIAVVVLGRGKIRVLCLLIDLGN